MSRKLCPSCGTTKISYESKECMKCFKAGQAITGEDVIRILRRASTAVTPEDIARSLRTVPAKVETLLKKLAADGRTVYQFGERWSFEKAPDVGGTYTDPLVSDADGWHRFGAMGDTHLCSKQERLEELHDLYRIYKANDIQTVLHTGNYIDGEARFNKFELNVHGMDNQLGYMAEHYPKIPGIRTLAVSGDDHEGWYAQREGVDIGRYMESVMRRHGRTDIRNLGYMECYIPLVHKKTGASSMIHVMHPGGGSAYATSYTVQKIVEGYEGGEKPAILLAGHYHKAEHLEVRNVHAFQTGCFQDQTVFARKKKLTFTIGGWIILARQNPDTGAIEEVVSYFKSYFNRGYYVNNRWSLSGPVAKVPRIKL